MRLAGKVAIVTGATSGIGQATAIMFAREGAKVVLVGRDESRGRAILESMRSDGGEAVFFKADISKSAEAKKMIEDALRIYGRVNILVNNAGVTWVGNILETPEETWDLVIDINLKGVYLCCKYLIPHMIKDSEGTIINIASASSFMAMTSEAAYDTSKGGVLMLTRAMALDFAKNNIRINCICPGVIDTPMLKPIYDSSPDPKAMERNLARLHPVGRVGSPEEVAKVALFLAADAPEFMTGAALAVDGGLLAGWP